MIVTNDRHPGDSEYLAAASGLPEQTPSLAVWHGYANGDRLSYRLHHWGPQSFASGRVIGDAGPDRVWVNNESTNTPDAVDVRPWPEGNVLPF